MLLIKLLRKLGKLLRGGAMDRQIVLGALFGVLIGMVPGLNLTLVLAILLLLALNAHVGIALLGLALGKLLCLLLAPVTFQIGYALIHGIGLEGLFRWAADAPVLALMDLHVYALLGGLPVAIVLGLAFGWLMARLVAALRSGIVRATERSPRMHKLAQNRLVQAFMWLVFGRRKDQDDILEADQPLLRKAGLVLAGIALAVIAALELLFLDYAVQVGAERGLGFVNGAQVDVKSADMSLTGGKLKLMGLQATDPDQPTENAWEAEVIEADLAISDLLRKRYVVNLLAVSNVKFGTAREQPGKVYRRPEAERAPDEEPTAVDYFEKAQELRRYLQKLQEFLEKHRARKDEQERKERTMQLAANRGYLEMSARDLLTERPLWVVREVRVNGLALPFAEGLQRIEARDISSHPSLLRTPMLLRMVPAEGGEPIADVEMHFEQQEPVHKAAFRFDGLSLNALPLGDRSPVDVREGKADFRMAGTFSSTSLQMPFAIKLRKLEADTHKGEGFLGLNPQTAAKMIKNVREFELTGALRGTLGAPRLRLDPNAVLASMKESLVAAGKQQLANLADEKLGEMGDKLKESLGEEVSETLRQRLEAGLPGLGKSDPADEADEEPDGQEQDGKSPEDLLRNLF